MRPDLDHKERLQQEDVYRCDIVHNFHAVIAPYFNSVVLDMQFPERQDIRGVNIYRSVDSDQDGFELVTPDPISTCRWVDSPSLSLKTGVRAVDIKKFEDPIPYICFVLPEVAYAPVGLTRKAYTYKADPEPLITKMPMDVVDPLFRAYYKGEPVAYGQLDVTKDTFNLFLDQVPDDLIERYVQMPDDIDPDNWTFDYFVLKKNAPLTRAFYRAVLVDRAGRELTPLLKSPVAMVSGEKISWIWRSALQRNQWMIEHEGEQVQLFLRKWAGDICDCQKDDYFDLRCNDCYGVGFIGGYYGPYHFLAALEDSLDEDIDRQDSGYRQSIVTAMWSIPFPFIRTGDVFVRANGDHLVVGGVTNTTASGSIIQQSYRLESSHMEKFRMPAVANPIIISRYSSHCPVERSISKKFTSISY